METNIEKLLDEALEASKNGEHKTVELKSAPGTGKTKKVLSWAEEKSVNICRLSVEMYALLEKMDLKNVFEFFVTLAKENTVLFFDDVEKMPSKISVMINDGNIGLNNYLFVVMAETTR